jgi:hypothetical protein
MNVAHLVFLGMWLGVVITEVLFEFAGSDGDSLRAAARFHYYVDKFGELSILLGVLLTGTMLAVRAWPLTTLHFIKIATSLVAVGSALICTLWVFQRRNIEDVNVLLGFCRYLDPGGRCRGLRDACSLSRAGLFPGVAPSALRHSGETHVR